MEFPLGITKKIHSFYTPITDTEVYALSQDYVNEQLAENIEFASYLAHYYAHEAHELLLRISSMEKTNSYDKLKAALKFLAVHHAEARHSGWRRVRFPINHQLLADMIGITRESTTLVMKKFHQNKLIRSPRPTILEINFKKLITF
jgi:CRP-like cAMP-binding protein